MKNPIKNPIKKLTVSLFVGLSIAMNVQADMLVLLSPYQDKVDVQQQVITTIELLTELPLGEKITVLNGETASTIATLNVPEDERLSDYNSRINHNVEAIAALGQFIQSVDIGDRTAGAMNLPLVLGEVARYHRYANDILVMGSGGFDIQGVSQEVIDGDKILLDSNISQSPRQSLFGTQGIEERLKGFRIHWLLPAPIADTEYKDSSQRFWHLFLHHQRAELVSFTHDKASVLRRLKANAPALPMAYELTLASESRQMKQREAALFNLPLSKAPLDTATWHRPQKLRLGIRWQGHAIDLDLYASTTPTRAPVYFANPMTSVARYFKDILSGGNSKTTLYETIAFHRAVDLCKLVIGINHYGGTTAIPINGTLRTEIGNKVYETAFTLNSSTGNRGDDIQAVLSMGEDTLHSQRFKIYDIVDSANLNQNQNQNKQRCKV